MKSIRLIKNFIGSWPLFKALQFRQHTPAFYIIDNKVWIRNDAATVIGIKTASEKGALNHSASNGSITTNNRNNNFNKR